MNLQHNRVIFVKNRQTLSISRSMSAFLGAGVACPSPRCPPTSPTFDRAAKQRSSQKIRARENDREQTAERMIILNNSSTIKCLQKPSNLMSSTGSIKNLEMREFGNDTAHRGVFLFYSFYSLYSDQFLWNRCGMNLKFQDEDNEHLHSSQKWQ